MMEESHNAQPAKKISASEFNSWVIGGQYTKNRLKRNQSKPLEPVGDNANTKDHHNEQLRIRREQLRQDLESHNLAYSPKVASALRNSSRGSREGGRTPTKERSPARGSSREQPNSRERGSSQERSPPDQSNENTSSGLRGRLKVSFAQITATHAYGTLFPPLLTPYNRPCLLGQAQASKHAATDAQIPDAANVPPPKKPHNELSVVAGERRRAQPTSGPKAFFPSGSSSGIYRHFMHIPPGDRGTFTVSSR